MGAVCRLKGGNKKAPAVSQGLKCGVLWSAATCCLVRALLKGLCGGYPLQIQF